MRDDLGEALSEIEESFFREGQEMDAAHRAAPDVVDDSTRWSWLVRAWVLGGWSRLASGWARLARSVQPAQISAPTIAEAPDEEEWEWKIAIARARATTAS
jgi:hypothetical protein